MLDFTHIDLTEGIIRSISLKGGINELLILHMATQEKLRLQNY